MTQLQTIYESVLGQVFDRRNFHKKMTALGYVIAEKEKVSCGGRPATLYHFDEEKYCEVIKNLRVF